LLLDDPNFFYNYHSIIEEKEYNEIIINEHCERINDFINFTNYFIDLIKNGFFSGYISFIQYKLTKQVIKKINNIWYSEHYAKKIYNVKNNIPSRTELSYLFDIIEIIYYKIQIINHNINKDSTVYKINEKELLNNYYYLDTINKEKFFYKNQLELLI
jgi:hypothetical protein